MLLRCILGAATIFSFIASATATDRPKVICFGDSITNRGYPKILGELLDVEAINAGVGGNTTGKALRRMQADVLSKSPDVVVIFFGTNDLRVDNSKVHVPLVRYKENLAEMIEACQKQQARIVLCTLPPIAPVPFFTRHEHGPFDAAGGLGNLVKSYQNAAIEVATSHDIPLVDLQELLAKQPKWMSGDGVHPSEEGNAIIAKHIARAVTPLLIKPASKAANKAAKAKPNVLFISIDDLNDWEGAMGGNRQAKTPHMDNLFRQGMLFRNAHCSQAVCTASRNSLLSGLHPSTSGWYSSTASMRETYEQVMGDHKMLPQHFKDNGYKTLAVGKVFHQGISDYKDRTKDFWDVTAPGYKVPKHLLARGEGYGGKHFYPFPKTGSQIIDRYGMKFSDGNSLCYGALERDDIPGGKMFDEQIADWAVDQLNQEHAKPFFLAVGFVRPHVPYTAPKEYFDLYNLDEIVIPKVPEDEMSDIPLMGKSIAYGTIRGGDHYAVVNLSDTYWKEMVYGYLACVSFVDAQAGKVLDALADSKYADNTIVVLWSDHGQHLGEKRHWRKQALWEESTRVPLFFKAAGVSHAGSHSDQAVSLLDIYPTLVELCDLPTAAKLDGQSLVPFMKDPAAQRTRPVLSSWYYGNYAVRSNDWRYIRYRDGTEELYDHRNDPGEHVNLSTRAEFASVIAEHNKWLPKIDVLPAASDEWKGDKLDRRIQQWQANDSVSDWLK